MANYRLVASFTEGDVNGVAWLRKVGDRRIVRTSDGVEVYFTSPLGFQALQTKTSVMRNKLGLTVAKVEQLQEEDWQLRAVAQEEPSSSSPSASLRCSRRATRRGRRCC